MKKVLDDQYVFRGYFRVRKEVNDKIQTIISYIKYELQTSIENNISDKTIKEKLFWLQSDGLKHCSPWILWKNR